MRKNKKILLILVVVITLINIPNLFLIDVDYSSDNKNINEYNALKDPKGSYVYIEDLGVYTYCVEVDGDYAYVGTSVDGVAIVNITNPTNPEFVITKDSLWSVEDICIKGDYAFIADQEGIEVIDISDPTDSGTPVFLEILTDSVYSISVSGDYAYVGGTDELHVVDISIPNTPVEVASEDLMEWTWPNSIYISGDYAYLAQDNEGLAIIDISNPLNPGTPIYKNTTGRALDVYISGDFAYIADGFSGLAVINISDPTNPGDPIYQTTNGYANDVCIEGNYAYVADGFRLAVINIADPTNPTIPQYEDIATGARKVFIEGNYAYLAGESSLAVVDISENITPKPPIYEDTSPDANGIYISGDYAYVADRESGLAIINISDPTDPEIAAYRDTADTSLDVFIDGDYAFIADGYSGLAVINIADPTNPGVPAYRATNWFAIDVFIDGDYAYVADFASGLAIIDISDPTSPGPLFSEALNGYAYGVCVSGDYAYIADYDYGLAVVDINDPTNPGPTYYEDTTGHAYDVFVSGDFAYVACYESGLAIIDISNPTNPGAPVYVDTTGESIEVFVSGDDAFVADRSSGLAIIDISDPTNPGEPQYVNTTGSSNGVYISGDYAYVADYASGLAVIQVRQRIDMIDPIIIDAPSDFVLEAYNFSGETISWTAIDMNPFQYIIELQGYGIVDGPKVWFNDTAVIYSIPDDLNVGENNYQINFTDSYGNSFIDSVTITIEDTTIPHIIDAPTDFNVDYDYTSISISWTATDPYPNNYTIELQGTGTVAGPAAWENGTSITYNIPEGLDIGEYVYIVNFTDEFNNFIIDSVVMTIGDTKDPIITNAPSDFSIEAGYSGVSISWTATDPYPYNYTIELQGIGIVAGPAAWLNATTIIYNIPDGLGVGIYLYTVNFTDQFGNYIIDSVSITVDDTTDPIFTDVPSDFTIESGYSGVNISWTATDINPGTYTIELQGTGVIVGPTAWSSGSIIIYNVPDGLAEGEYLYTITVTDAYGNSNTHSVTMTIKRGEEGGAAIPFGYYYLIFLISGMITLLITQKRRIKKIFQ